MSFLRGIIDSFSSIFNEESKQDHSVLSSTSSASMNTIDGVPVSNERIAYKFKGYFDLAKEEIAKGVRAEEWGLHDDALLHYRNSQRIMNEASSTPSPSFISSSEKEKVRSYREKISKWQNQVSERLWDKLWVSVQRTLASPSSTSVSSTASRYRRSSSQNTPVPRSGIAVARNPKDATASPKPVKESGNVYDDKLVEMINTTIMDRSPSVKWDDVAGLDGAKKALLEMVISERRKLVSSIKESTSNLEDGKDYCC